MVPCRRPRTNEALITSRKKLASQMNSYSVFVEKNHRLQKNCSDNFKTEIAKIYVTLNIFTLYFIVARLPNGRRTSFKTYTVHPTNSIGMLENIRLRLFWNKSTGVAGPLVLGGHRHVAMNLPWGRVTAEREAHAFWVVWEHGFQDVSEFLGL